jgi:serine/threonine protein kinase
MKSTTLTSKLTLALKVFEQTLNGLEDLKKVGILHRDLKEDNILYKIPTPKGKPKPSEIVIKIGDFGLSCVPGLKDLKCAIGFAGSRQYIDPKIVLLIASGGYKDYTIENFWTDKNDMYSLAVILYQIIFGEEYLTGSDWYKIDPADNLDKLEPKLVARGYLDVYQRNMGNVDNLIKQYENSKTKENKKIVKMLNFIKRNLVPFDYDQRTTLDESVAFYT